MPLCWKCREFLINKWGDRYYTTPSNHCHHNEPEKKPNVCNLNRPELECLDFEMKAARGWCKDCRHRRVYD
jgi:hypothetical protein